MNRKLLSIGIAVVATLLVWWAAAQNSVATSGGGGDFDGCGTLFEGVECLLFDADSAGVYLLENYGHFRDGDRVHVAGWLDPFCITICMQGNGCIHDNTICPCDSRLGDLDGDGDVDLNDFAIFLECYTGPGVPRTPECECADLDGDNDVDFADYGVFQIVFTGD